MSAPRASWCRWSRARPRPRRIDVAFVGHTDLSVSLGLPLEFDRPEFVKARDAVLAACQRHGKIAGNLVGNPKWGKAWIRKGFRMIAYMGDIWLLQSALQEGIDAMKDAAPKGKATAKKGR